MAGKRKDLTLNEFLKSCGRKANSRSRWNSFLHANSKVVIILLPRSGGTRANDQDWLQDSLVGGAIRMIDRLQKAFDT
jgi:hypothetical protein